MKEGKFYQVQLVGNVNTVKRMVASLFLVDSKKKEQILKVCICDDLPHVINAVDSQQRSAPFHELLESGLTLQVGHGRSLTIRASVLDNHGQCTIVPHNEVVIPPEAIWESNAAFATDFKIKLERPLEDASIQVSITSKDDLDSDIPLSVPPRVHVMWQPKDVAGVQSIRKAWEMNDTQTLSKSQPQTYRKSGSLPRYQQPVYQKIENMLQDRPSRRPQEIAVSPRMRDNFSESSQDHRQSSMGDLHSRKPLPVQDQNWNVVSSPQPLSDDDHLPQWAKGHDDQFDYDDVLVV